MSIPGYTPVASSGLSNPTQSGFVVTEVAAGIKQALFNIPSIIYSPDGVTWDLNVIYNNSVPDVLNGVVVSGVPYSSIDTPLIAYISGVITAMYGAIKTAYIDSITIVVKDVPPPVFVPPVCDGVVVANVAGDNPVAILRSWGYTVDDMPKYKNIFTTFVTVYDPETGGPTAVYKVADRPSGAITFMDIGDNRDVSYYMFVATFITPFGESLPSNILAMGPLYETGSITLGILDTSIPSYASSVRYYMNKNTGTCAGFPRDTFVSVGSGEYTLPGKPNPFKDWAGKPVTNSPTPFSGYTGSTVRFDQDCFDKFGMISEVKL